jgi:7-carboxy-7-deazaguanine synthase
MDLRVNEFFGPTFQGEGPFAGQWSHFLRLSRCNLHCEWCDTPYTWAHTEAKAAKHGSKRVYDRKEEEDTLSVDAVLSMIRMNSVKLLVVTGGEPLLQAEPLNELIEGLDPNVTVQFETAGTLPPLPQWSMDDGVYYVVSPKLENSGNTLKERFKVDALKALRNKEAAFKFVVTDKAELEEVKVIQNEIGILSEKIWIMPEGTTALKVLEGARALAQPVLDMGWNLTLRQHTLLWGDERGR